MDIITQYQNYRRIGKELNHKIMESCLNKDAMTVMGRLLGILGGGNVLFFDSEDETSVLMDFCLNEYRPDGQNAYQKYLTSNFNPDQTEQAIIYAIISSHTSLFRIKSISETDNSVVLDDLLNHKQNLNLIDINFSQTAMPGLLVFLRLIPFSPPFHMTSGVSFLYPGDLEQYLIRRAKKIAKKIKSENEDVKRFVSFYKLSKTDGLNVEYK